MDKNFNQMLVDLRCEINKTRKTILDLLEMAFGEHPKWPAARTCILRSLGKSGLEGAIETIDGRTGTTGGAHE